VIRINLLPREERVRRRTIAAPKMVRMPALGAFVPLAVLGLVGAAVVVTHTRQVARIRGFEQEIAALQKEAESYKPQLEKIRQITQQRQEVSNRLDIISALDRERYFRVRLMDEVARSMPDNMWLSKVAEQGDHRFAVEGVTFSNFIVARFMQDLEATPHWEALELGVIERGKIDGYNVMQFSMTATGQP
jgi:type IV pilus assembly protein PilN